MWRSFFKDKRWFYWSYGGGFFIITLLVLQTYLDVLFNSWYKDFYDILQTAEKEIYLNFGNQLKDSIYSTPLCNIICIYELVYKIMGISMERSDDIFVYALLESYRC